MPQPQQHPHDHACSVPAQTQSPPAARMTQQRKRLYFGCLKAFKMMISESGFGEGSVQWSFGMRSGGFCYQCGSMANAAFKKNNKIIVFFSFGPFLFPTQTAKEITKIVNFECRWWTKVLIFYSPLLQRVNLYAKSKAGKGLPSRVLLFFPRGLKANFGENVESGGRSAYSKYNNLSDYNG